MLNIDNSRAGLRWPGRCEIWFCVRTVQEIRLGVKFEVVRNPVAVFSSAAVVTFTLVPIHTPVVVCRSPDLAPASTAGLKRWLQPVTGDRAGQQMWLGQDAPATTGDQPQREFARKRWLKQQPIKTRCTELSRQSGRQQSLSTCGLTICPGRFSHMPTLRINITMYMMWRLLWITCCLMHCLVRSLFFGPLLLFLPLEHCG